MFKILFAILAFSTTAYSQSTKAPNLHITFIKTLDCTDSIGTNIHVIPRKGLEPGYLEAQIGLDYYHFDTFISGEKGTPGETNYVIEFRGTIDYAMKAVLKLRPGIQSFTGQLYIINKYLSNPYIPTGQEFKCKATFNIQDIG